MKSRYKKFKRAGRTLLAHRVIVERHLGRKLLDSEYVQHRNDDRYDNRIENLKVVQAALHHQQVAEKNRIHPREQACQVCKLVFTPARTKRKRAKTCSWECRNTLIGITKRAGFPVLQTNVDEVPHA